MKHKVLIVDDEKNVLNALKRILIKCDYECFFASSGSDGIDILKENDVSVIISDMRMPHMDGIEFLQNAYDLQPDAIRIILSGYADIATIMEAINKGHVWRYITKPWDEFDLKVSINNAIGLFEQGEERKRLFLEVQEKNKELADLNANLEKKVEERTLELKARNKLLRMVTEGDSVQDIISASYDVIADVLGTRDMFFYLPHNSKTLGSSNIVSTKITEALKDIENGNMNFENPDVSFFPIKKHDQLLGVLLVAKSEIAEGEGVKEKLKNILAILAISIAEDRLLGDMPEMMENIDKIIGNID